MTPTPASTAPVQIAPTVHDGRALLLANANARHQAWEGQTVDAQYDLLSLRREVHAMVQRGASFDEQLAFFVETCSDFAPSTREEAYTSSVQRLRCGHAVEPILSEALMSQGQAPERAVNEFAAFVHTETNRFGVSDLAAWTDVQLSWWLVQERVQGIAKTRQARNLLFVGVGPRLEDVMDFVASRDASTEGLARSPFELPEELGEAREVLDRHLVVRRGETNDARDVTAYFYVDGMSELPLLTRASSDESPGQRLSWELLEHEVRDDELGASVRLRFRNNVVGDDCAVVWREVQYVDTVCRIESGQAYCVDAETGRLARSEPGLCFDGETHEPTIPHLYQHFIALPDESINVGTFEPAANTKLEIQSENFRIPGIPGQDEWQSIRGVWEQVEASHSEP